MDPPSTGTGLSLPTGVQVMKPLGPPRLGTAGLGARPHPEISMQDQVVVRRPLTSSFIASPSARQHKWREIYLIKPWQLVPKEVGAPASAIGIALGVKCPDAPAG